MQFDPRDMAQQLPLTMRAMVYGSHTDVLDVRLKTDLQTPTPGSTLVIIEVMAAALNPVDFKIRTIPTVGKMDDKAIGWDLSGKVVHAPPGCGFEAGDEVFGFSKRIGEKHGSVAQFVEADPRYLAKKPTSVSHIEAAMLPLAGCTALQSLRDHGKVKAGDNVLVIGGSGGTGMLGVQIAKILGCKVTAICSAKNIPLIQGLGADIVHAYDSPQGPMPTDIADEDTFDCIFDTVTSPDNVDTDYEPIARPFLRTKRDPRTELDASGLEVDVAGPGRDGIYVAINSKSKWDWAFAIVAKYSGFLDLQRRNYKLAIYEQKKQDLEWLGRAVAEGKLRVQADDSAVEARFGLDKDEHGRKAFEALAGRRVKGKVVFGMSEAVWDAYLNLKKRKAESSEEASKT